MQTLLSRALVLLSMALAASSQAASFVDEFEGSGGAGPAWETANWRNGAPFGCTFAYSEVWKDQGKLLLNVNGGTGKCAEVRTLEHFTYGKFTVRVKASNFAGGNTSFFLYTGDAGTATHHEIDIELIKGGTVLHTNAWKNGQQYFQQYPIATGWQTLGFEWRANFVRWFSVDAAGREATLRQMDIAIDTPMKLMMNHWVSDNSADGIGFLGRWTGQGGPAAYDWVKVE